MNQFFKTLSRSMAMLGGIVLTFIILLTCVSILGRAMFSGLHSGFAQAWFPGLASALIDAGIGPVRGDFEVAGSLMAFAIFAFLPLTQMTNGHASVDIFTSWIPPRGQRVLRLIIEVLFALVLIVIATQLLAGTQSKLKSGQTTFLLEYPIWWAYAASLCGAVIAAIVAVYMVAVRVAELATGTTLISDEMGADL